MALENMEIDAIRDYIGDLTDKIRYALDQHVAFNEKARLSSTHVMRERYLSWAEHYAKQVLDCDARRLDAKRVYRQLVLSSLLESEG